MATYEFISDGLYSSSPEDRVSYKKWQCPHCGRVYAFTSDVEPMCDAESCPGSPHSAKRGLDPRDYSYDGIAMREQVMRKAYGSGRSSGKSTLGAELQRRAEEMEKQVRMKKKMRAAGAEREENHYSTDLDFDLANPWAEDSDDYLEIPEPDDFVLPEAPGFIIGGVDDQEFVVDSDGDKIEVSRMGGPDKEKNPEVEKTSVEDIGWGKPRRRSK
jgi:hypothetical protein